MDLSEADMRLIALALDELERQSGLAARRRSNAGEGRKHIREANRDISRNAATLKGRFVATLIAMRDN